MQHIEMSYGEAGDMEAMSVGGLVGVASITQPAWTPQKLNAMRHRGTLFSSGRHLRGHGLRRRH